jgi:osmotically-inducible protein OsmY
MKIEKVTLLFLMIFSTGCVRTVVTGSEIANGIARLHRDTKQVSADLALERALKDSIEEHRKDFLYVNNLSDFGCYDIKVMEGRVLLSGIVFDSKTRGYILEKVSENLKVRELLDELSLENRRGTSVMRFGDYILEKAIGMRIFLKSKVKSLNYEISVVDGKVYVLGIAGDKNEHELLTKLISTVSGVKEVVSYVITVNSIKKLKIEYV